MYITIIFQQDPKLPALLKGETKEEYKKKYGMYINPVKDRAKYKHIQGYIRIKNTVLLLLNLNLKLFLLHNLIYNTC